MIFSRYNFITSIEKGIYVLYNTRTSYFAEIGEIVFNELNKIKQMDPFSLDEINLPNNIKEEYVKAKVFVPNNEDNHFFSLKKYLRYKQAFARENIALVIAPTFACNFKCIYCYEKDLPSKVMDESTQNQIIEFLKHAQQNKQINLTLCWHGGEPLVAFSSIKGILTKIEQEHSIKLVSHSMVTNGYLLDDEKCYFLKKHKLESIQITIDGRQATHDKSRIHKLGIPTYETIIQNIERIFRIIPECHVTVRVNVHSQNQKDFPFLYKELKDKWAGNNFTINMVYANEVDSSCQVACLSDKDKLSFVYELYKEHDIKDIFISSKPKVGGCLASCINSFVVGPEGEIYKCWVDVGKPHKVVGDIFSFKNSGYILSEYTVGCDMFSDKKCMDCTFSPICEGGCAVRRYNSKYNNIAYDPCPVDDKGFATLLKIYYNKKYIR